ncbi:hypothetical protein EJD97_020435 [Solanum chilense]|uniref:DUF4283 domain-containing protein n=1 Tax=Solanum chilense TaxID=4083 RepID=A0A6N2AZC6_SOLCI|nr:hypothetical protein EJD97_020435 [Solanum chilense]
MPGRVDRLDLGNTGTTREGTNGTVASSSVKRAMKNGDKVIELKKEEVDKAAEEWKQSLILFVVGDSPTIAVVERVLIEMDVAREFPRKVKVENHNVMVEHKWHVREGIKHVAQYKKVKKWQPEVDGSKVGELEMQGSKELMEVLIEEIWKLIPTKTIIKSPNNQWKPQVLVRNGFNILSTFEKGSTSNEVGKK